MTNLFFTNFRYSSHLYFDMVRMFFYSSHDLHNHHLDFKLKMLSWMFSYLGKRQLGHFMPIFTDRTKIRLLGYWFFSALHFFHQT